MIYKILLYLTKLNKVKSMFKYTFYENASKIKNHSYKQQLIVKGP